MGWLLYLISSILGWGYVLCWSAAFYTQGYENYKRQSVVGLSFDWITYNAVAFACYTIFNATLLFGGPIKQAYLDHWHGSNSVLPIPIHINDVVFSAHGLIATLILIGQCFFLKRGAQHPSLWCILISSASWIVIYGIFIASSIGYSDWLSFIYTCGVIVVFIFGVKNLPQVTLNCQRESTMGWYVGNSYLELAGGILSFSQMLVDAIGNDVWSTLMGNAAKFSLAILSILFNTTYLIQHYICFPNRQQPNSWDDQEFLTKRIYYSPESTPNHSPHNSTDYTLLLEDYEPMVVANIQHSMDEYAEVTVEHSPMDLENELEEHA